MRAARVLAALATAGLAACSAPWGSCGGVRTVRFSDEQVWSEGPRAQHHATVAVVPRDGPPTRRDPAAVVAWTAGPLTGPHQSQLRAVDLEGQPLGEPATLDGGGRAAKPDVEVDANGAVVTALQEGGRVLLERRDLATWEAETVEVGAARGNASVDLAVLPSGGVALVWFTTGDVATYRSAVLGADLRAVPGLPAALHLVEASANAAPDLDADPGGGLGVAWVDQHAPGGTPDQLLLDSWSADGALRWTTELDVAADGVGARRATVASDTRGRWAVAWRRRPRDAPTPSTTLLGFVEVDGTWLHEPFAPLSGDTDDVVLATVGDDAVWVVWTQDPDPVDGVGVIEGALLSFPAGAVLRGPFVLSSSSRASRPHTDVAAWGPGRFGVAVSWEEEVRGTRQVRGVVGEIR